MSGLEDTVTINGENREDVLILVGLEIVSDSVVVIVLGLAEISLSIAEDVKISINMVDLVCTGSEEAGGSVTLGSKSWVLTVAREISTVLSVSVTTGVAKMIELSVAVT